MRKFFSLLLNSTASVFKNYNGRLAFKLLCKVKRTHKEESANSFLDAATQTKLHSEGFEGTVYKLGTGSKNILFLHGWKSHSARWAPVVELLDLEEFTCYALDAPAHGRSAGDSMHLEIYRKFVVQIVEEAGGMHAVVAHSLGGLITAYAFLANPQLPVNRFIITGAPAGMQSIYDFFQYIVKLNSLVMENLDRHISSRVTKIPAKQIRLEAFFEKVENPVLVIHDQEDRICPIGPIKSAAAMNSRIQTFYTDGLGHDLKSVVVYKRMAEFLGENSAANTGS
jgi:pimeloyl-ACP methyl ester carboxylesterase